MAPKPLVSIIACRCRDAVDRGKEEWEKKRVSHQSGGLHKSHGSGALSVGVAMATGGVKDGKGRT